ncbi:MAG TPA: 6,7-dimethyl-8-ribityllumazine synthase [Acidimicrobiales bacterium]|nr:6,7-dimethyl-8-ribityllumazine synthase [Acidimicrobiales bacterium]
MAQGKGTLEGLVAPEGTRIGVAVARFNEDITTQLLAGAQGALRAAGVGDDAATVIWVPGAFELPLAAQHLLAAGCDAVVALGCVIRGDTGHYDFVAGECASGLQRVQLDSGKPVVFGVLTTENHEQAVERAAVDRMNKGGEAVDTAVEMLHTLATIKD